MCCSFLLQLLGSSEPYVFPLSGALVVSLRPRCGGPVQTPLPLDFCRRSSCGPCVSGNCHPSFVRYKPRDDNGLLSPCTSLGIVIFIFEPAWMLGGTWPVLSPWCQNASRTAAFRGLAVLCPSGFCGREGKEGIITGLNRLWEEKDPSASCPWSVELGRWWREGSVTRALGLLSLAP